MINIAVQPEFHGPSIVDLEPVLDLIDGVVDVRWTNSKPEQTILEQHRNRNFLLLVEDLSLMEHTATALGLRYVLDLGISQSALAALVYQKTANWRAFAEGVSSSVCRSLITRLSADVARKGNHSNLAIIATECQLDGISPIDADVLLRISYMSME